MGRSEGKEREKIYGLLGVKAWMKGVPPLCVVSTYIIMDLRRHIRALDTPQRRKQTSSCVVLASFIHTRTADLFFFWSEAQKTPSFARATRRSRWWGTTRFRGSSNCSVNLIQTTGFLFCWPHTDSSVAALARGALNWERSLLEEISDPMR